jgi:hypothetical protein
MLEKISYREEIPTVLKLIGCNKRMCELGVQKGAFLWFMIINGEPEHAVGIDLWDAKGLGRWWTQEQHDGCYNHVKQIPTWAQRYPPLRESKIDIVKGDHSILCDNYENNFFDFVYIDSEHTYEPTKRDIAQWWPKVKVGGVFAGHDYKNKSGVDKLGGHFKWGVIEAVNEFVEDKRIEHFCLTKDKHKSWIILKTHD